MNRRILPIGLLAAATLAVSACSSSKEPAVSTSSAPPPASATASPTPPPSPMGQPFRNGAFEITVTKVVKGVTQLDLTAGATDAGLQPYKPENGQFIVVYVTAKNIGTKPASMSITRSTLIDSAGKEYASGGPYLYSVANQALGGDDQQPDTTKSGWIAFDVPLTVTTPTVMVVQSDAYIATTNPPSAVKLT